jgi:hypothetical protein
MATSLDARIDEALFGPHAAKEWEDTLAAALEALLSAPLGDLLDATATADFLDLLAERAFLNDTARPAATALACFLAGEAKRDERPLASYLTEETRADLATYAASAKPVPRALLDALLAEKGVRAFIEGFLFDAMREFYERANPFFAESGLPAMIKKLIPIGSGAVLKALEVARGEFENRLEPELRKFLGGFTGRALDSVKAGVGAGGREMSEALARTVLTFLLERPVKDLAAELRDERIAKTLELACALLADLDDDETFRARRRELVEGYVRKNAARPVREVLADHGVRVAPHVPSLAAATFPLMRGVVALAPVRAWFRTFAERAGGA